VGSGWRSVPDPTPTWSARRACRAFVPLEFCDRWIDAPVRRADLLQLRDPAAAGQLWSRMDYELVDCAPSVLLST